MKVTYTATIEIVGYDQKHSGENGKAIPLAEVDKELYDTINGQFKGTITVKKSKRVIEEGEFNANF